MYRSRMMSQMTILLKTVQEAAEILFP